MPVAYCKWMTIRSRHNTLWKKWVASRQLKAALLASLWLLYALLGNVSLGGISYAICPPVNHCASAAPSAVCHCKMCHGIMRGGILVCCCCGNPIPPPAGRAILTASCDMGAPAVLAFVTSWPAMRTDVAVSALLRSSRPRFVRPTNQSAFSISLGLLTPPPCYL